MNLNQITARIGELSAELLTLHNNLSFLVEGALTRQQPERTIRDFLDLRVGDKVVLKSAHNVDVLVASSALVVGNVYDVADLESQDYTGRYNVLIETLDGEDAVWVNYTILDLVA